MTSARVGLIAFLAAVLLVVPGTAAAQSVDVFHLPGNITGGEFRSAPYTFPDTVFIGSTGGAALFVADNGLQIQSPGGNELSVADSGIGIGTRSPASNRRLTVRGDGAYFVKSNDGSALTIDTDSDNIARLNTGTSDALVFSVADSEAARIDSSGQVGIGTTSPGSTLEIGGDGTLTFSGLDSAGNTIIDTVLSDGTQGLHVQAAGGSQELFDITDSNGNVQFRVNTQNGNVGIGTTTPSARLEVDSGGTSSGIHLDDSSDTTTDVWFRLQEGGTSKWGMSPDWASGRFTLYDYSSGSPALQVAENGNVHIRNRNLDFNNNAIVNADWSNAADLDGSGNIADFGDAADLNSAGSLSISSDVDMNGNALDGNVEFVDFKNIEFGNIPNEEAHMAWDNSEGIKFYWNGAWRKLTYEGIDTDTNAQTECSGDDYLAGDGHCHADSTGEHHDHGDTSSSNELQDLSDVLSRGNSAGSYNIDVSDNDLNDVNNIYQDGGNFFGGCSSGSYVNSIGSDGSVTCETDDTGSDTNHHDDPGDHSAASDVNVNGWDITNVQRLYTDNIYADDGSAIGVQNDLSLSDTDITGANDITADYIKVHSSKYDSSDYGYLNSAGDTGFCSGCDGYYSIQTTDRISAEEFNAFSDRRIKNVLGERSPQDDLEIVKALDIMNYEYIDQRANGPGKKTGLVAQEVEDIYPQAVSNRSGFVPTIFSFASEISLDKSSGVATITLSDPHGLEDGDVVKLLTDDRTIRESVKDVTSEKTFKISTDWSSEPDDVFVHSKKVDDYRTLDYDQLSVLGLNAIKNLDKRVSHLEEENADLRERLEEQEDSIERLEERVEDL